jgi:APA family basic amino acid/polyamine antiporter
VTPVLFVVSALALVLNTLIVQPGRSMAGLLVVVTGIPAFYAWRAHGARHGR